jgi:hypothetical protein
MIKNVYKSWKTTVLGLIFIACGLSYVMIKASPDYIIMSILLASGIAMLFFPDDIIKKLRNVINNKEL